MLESVPYKMEVNQKGKKLKAFVIKAGKQVKKVANGTKTIKRCIKKCKRKIELRAYKIKVQDDVINLGPSHSKIHNQIAIVSNDQPTKFAYLYFKPETQNLPYCYLNEFNPKGSTTNPNMLLGQESYNIIKMKIANVKIKSNESISCNKKFEVLSSVQKPSNSILTPSLDCLSISSKEALYKDITKSIPTTPNKLNSRVEELMNNVIETSTPTTSFYSATRSNKESFKYNPISTPTTSFDSISNSSNDSLLKLTPTIIEKNPGDYSEITVLSVSPSTKVNDKEAKLKIYVDEDVQVVPTFNELNSKSNSNIKTLTTVKSIGQNTFAILISRKSSKNPIILPNINELSYPYLKGNSSVLKAITSPTILKSLTYQFPATGNSAIPAIVDVHLEDLIAVKDLEPISFCSSVSLEETLLQPTADPTNMELCTNLDSLLKPRKSKKFENEFKFEFVLKVGPSIATRILSIYGESKIKFLDELNSNLNQSNENCEGINKLSPEPVSGNYISKKLEVKDAVDTLQDLVESAAELFEIETFKPKKLKMIKDSANYMNSHNDDSISDSSKPREESNIKKADQVSAEVSRDREIIRPTNSDFLQTFTLPLFMKKRTWQ